MLKDLLNNLAARFETLPFGYPDQATWHLFRSLRPGKKGAAPADDPGEAQRYPEAGANFNHQDPEGYTPLMLAVIGRLPRAAQYLLDHGAGPNYKNRDRWSALMYAARNDDREMADMLLFYGAHTWLPTPSGMTVYHIAKNDDFRRLVKQTLSDLEAGNGNTMKTLHEIKANTSFQFKPLK